MQPSHPTQKNTQVCCARAQPQIRKEDLDSFVKRTDVQLRNLPNKYGSILEGMSIYDIREMFHDSDIPFRFEGCSRGNLTCCCTCMFKCSHRCPQDTMYRAYLLCGALLEAPEERFGEIWARSSATARMLYKELTSEHPRYQIVLNIVEDSMSIRSNKNLREYMKNSDNPNKYDYAPVFAYSEREIKLPSGEVDIRYQKKVNTETGEALIYNWPKSGVCPYCLPYGLINRRRIKGDGHKGGWRTKNHDYSFDASMFKDKD